MDNERQGQRAFFFLILCIPCVLWFKFLFSFYYNRDIVPGEGDT